ncbi:MAG: MBL fold metallo-hydrolase [Candidatus Amulumruptor caecigallinarius]|nr:MBL fold metallo-hydrolase [Candidatus Amulumruptor caecigallinarius]MCM1396873.1 MBL fold metallo-hydrolase [Candidatus Amulumruptor caecigallinarius]MCM1454183.1 MBL fold metallo-hydrolase [bacterium]
MARQNRRYSASPYASMPSLFSDDELDAPPMVEEVSLDALRAAPVVKFMSFGSGSSGNCAFLTDGTTGLIIDAGVDPEHVERSLARHGYSMDCVRGILLTHDHGDHVRYVYKLAKAHNHLRVYCTPKAFNGIMRRHSIARRLKDYFQAIYKEFPFKIGGWEVTAFDVSHDGTDNAGFFLTNGPHRIAVATDLGCITPRVTYYMSQARNVIIESNYDAAMLATGPYPEFLKARIAADNGHLDNTVTAGFVGRLYAGSDLLQRVYLCHLSHDNNTPATAIGAVERELRALDPGIEIVRDDTVPPTPSATPRRRLLVDALPRFEASVLYTFRLPGSSPATSSR